MPRRIAESTSIEPARSSPITRDGNIRASSKGHIVRDWWEEFGPVVLTGKAAQPWLPIVNVDSTGYRPRLRSERTEPYFRVCAVQDGRSHQLVQLAYYRTGSDWEDFFGRLPSSPGHPEVVVVDRRSPGIRTSVHIVRHG